MLGPVRVIRPGTAVTMDFIATRLNIFLDDTDTVTRVSCG
ncbi:MAG: I78 family peptidase inhibitor [Pseudomonadota bacterium]